MLLAEVGVATPPIIEGAVGDSPAVQAVSKSADVRALIGPSEQRRMDSPDDDSVRVRRDERGRITA
jgi:hypothetical protein